MAGDPEIEREDDLAQNPIQKMTELKQLRSSTKGNIGRIKNFIVKKGSALSIEELECRLGILESYFKQCISVQASIDKICPTADVAANAAVVAEVEETYVTTKTKIMTFLSKRRPSAPDTSFLNTTTSVSVPRIRREVKLPTFEGKYSEFPKFISLFNKLIDQDKSLDDCERFLILKEHLGARPLAAVADFDVTEENYLKAVKRLTECFDKKSLMFEEHVSALFSIQRVSKPSANHLRHVIDSVNAHISAMLSLGDYKNIANSMIIHLVMERLDEESQVKWEESVDYRKISTWEECSAVLSRRCQNLEARESKGLSLESKSTYTQKNSKNKQSSLAITKSSCGICNGGSHDLAECNEFLRMTLRNRYIAARKSKVCFTCLRKGHWQKVCTAQKCSECGAAHHKLLHKISSPPANVVVAQHQQQSDKLNDLVAASTSRSAVLSTVAEPEVFLATAVVLVSDSFGRFHRARAILDSASQINLMCEKLAQKLLLKRSPCELAAIGVGEVSTTLKKYAVAKLKSSVNETEYNLGFFLLPRITTPKPDRHFDVSSWSIPKNIILADPDFNTPGRIDLLLGAEIFLDLLCVGRIMLQPDLPRLQKTRLGWIVSGKAAECSVPFRSHSLMINSCESADIKLDQQLEKFWEVEQVNNKKKFWTEEEAECEKIFLETTQRDDTGRFVVKIPFKNEVSQLGESFHNAERRFLSLRRRLNNDLTTRELYDDFMKEYLRLGHMTVVEKDELEHIKYYSPHQCVLRPESSSTKLRVVFDCSAKTSSGMSLNDVMMKGPVVQDDLLSIVLRFRCYKYGITADVCKMYRQMWVTEEDANYQAVLWQPPESEAIQVYRLKTITYGTTSAPYLATRCLNMLGESCVAEYPMAARAIMSDFYMDDLISGTNKEKEIFELYHQLTSAVGTAQLSLRKWYSNSTSFLESLGSLEKEKTLRVNEADIIKTLGIVWAPVEDTFRYVWPMFDVTRAVTKRIVLSELAKLFDPLGLINPVIVKGKIFMQDMWILKLNWDESLPLDMYNNWVEYRGKLKGVEDIAVPRYVLSDNFCRVEMHGFADASKRAYGCCIYIRTVAEDGRITVRLWSAKSRVAPLKTQSLPRLELLAAELLSELVCKTKANFPLDINGTYLWTDSEIVLDWLSEHPSHWNTFIANRVSSIQEQCKTAIWRHVPSKLNPADIISRGAYAFELHDSIWFTGPQFLLKYYCDWPVNKTRQKRSEVEEERVRSPVSLLVQAEKPVFVSWMERHSDVQKLLRLVTLLRFAFRKLKPESESLDESLMRIVYALQQHYFREEFAILSKQRDLPASSKYKSLSLFIENENAVPLIRVGGRLANANLPYDSKHQILLPTDSKLVKTYVRHIHRTHYHASTQALMALLRQRFWIPHARKLVRSVVGSCLHCFRYRPKVCNQLMGDLPVSRVSVARPFTVSGVDFCGPFITTVNLRGARTTKSYVAVFICFCTKAVHMEVVSDLTAKAFIAALKRFVARRGLCAQLFCDNATNFVGARRELKEMRQIFFDQQVQNKISAYCIAKNIEFHHIPPRSPHFGGLWEAAVKSAKYHLNRVFGESHLTFEELSTVVAEIEAILNSRPLTTMSNDPNDESVLTPGHFLTGGPIAGIAEPILDAKEWSYKDRWLRVSAIQQHFWKRWSMEYLHELQQKVKWTKKQKNLEVGELVLVAEDNLPPKQWLLGRVVSVHKDAKGVVRVAEVKTKNGQIRRAIHNLAPIPRSSG
ncbi:uncharacterized protein LOC131996995 [Stomoxys calcitrans]|uniref:uncharacterized protein LOC131996995 n=1 Tax=Stomoxys calcitrans TaxID=35570 RepID=UPI0027E2C41F|nr:uncharacterized protein LOC131996995 [Stomoxys calcitrans]